MLALNNIYHVTWVDGEASTYIIYVTQITTERIRGYAYRIEDSALAPIYGENISLFSIQDLYKKQMTITHVTEAEKPLKHSNELLQYINKNLPEYVL